MKTDGSVDGVDSIGTVLMYHPRHVTHLAAGTGAVLAIEMDGRARHIEPAGVIRDLIADQVDHFDPPVAHRPAERPAGDCADVLLELRDRAAIEGPMAGIVHARRDLVDQEGMTRAFAHHE